MSTRLTELFQVRKSVKASPPPTPLRKRSLRDKSERRRPFKDVTNLNYDNSPISSKRGAFKSNNVDATNTAATMEIISGEHQLMWWKRRRQSSSHMASPSSSSDTSTTTMVEEVDVMEILLSAGGCPFSQEEDCRSIEPQSAHSDYHSSPECPEHYSLKIVPNPQKQHTAFRSIDGRTLTDLLERMTREEFLEKYVLVDCRYPYEYEGGHILYAINIYEKTRIRDVFLRKNEPRRIPIFYCEFSQKRGPTMAMELRTQDRNDNVYPNIHYKEVYILDRGYRNFYARAEYRRFCLPQNYVEMFDPRYKEQLKQFDGHVKQKRFR